MLGISKAILDLVQFGHQVKSGANTTRLLEELNVTAKSMDNNMGKILIAQEESRLSTPMPAHPTLTNQSERSAALAEGAASRGLEAKSAIRSAKRKFDIHLTTAKEMAVSMSVSDMEDQPIEPIQNVIQDYKVVSNKILGKLGRFQAISDTEMVIVHSLTLDNGWVVILQEGNYSKNAIFDPKDQRIIYQDIFGLTETTGKFTISKLFGKDGLTANYSTGRGLGGSVYPATESETYYFAGNLRDDHESVVGVTTARNKEQNFVDNYEGEFSAKILEPLNFSGEDGYVAELARNGYGIRTITGKNSFWWQKGKFEDGSPDGFGVTSDSKRGEQLIQYSGGVEVMRQDR